MTSPTGAVIPSISPDVGEVVVCGAGPVGLLLAAELAAHGIRPIVLECAETPPTMPKANGVVGHSAVELADRGYLAGTTFRLVAPPQFQFGPLTLPLGSDRRNPLHVLPIPQRSLEQLLERRAVEHGATVLRGREVVDFTQTDDEVTVEVRDVEDGTVEWIRAGYLVGCDGAHSVVRKRAGIGFPGFTSDRISRIARVTIPGGRIARAGDGFDIPGVGRFVAMRPNPLPGGSFSIAPAAVLDPTAPSDLYLISTSEPLGDAGLGETPTIDGLRASVRRVLGADLPFVDATARRSTVANSRQADAYRVGRVFLAGDAAHLFNAGGSALNVGLQDAFDLSGRLVAALTGDIDELGGYETARRPAGRRTLLHTRAQAALSRDDEDSQALREVVGELIADRKPARRLARMLEDS